MIDGEGGEDGSAKISGGGGGNFFFFAPGAKVGANVRGELK